MKMSKFTEEQIAFALRMAETCTRVAELRRLSQLDFIVGRELYKP
jgi:hypothetical protein